MKNGIMFISPLPRMTFSDEVVGKSLYCLISAVSLYRYVTLSVRLNPSDVMWGM